MKFIKTMTMAAACTAAMGIAPAAHAVNWLMLQGTEPEGAAGRAKVWGFIQPTYQKDKSELGPEPTRIGPNLEDQSQFQLQRARFGVRGTALPIDSKVNYFILAEFGQNGITDGGPFGEKQAVKLTDASITLNHIKGARIRTGLFKTPGPEEVFQGIFTFDYINFTDVSNQMMLERFPKGVSSSADGNNILFTNETDGWGSFGAARDIGVQVFDSFKSGGWEHSYALMIGNGNGLDTGGIALGEDKYLYWSSELPFAGGKGPWAHGFKVFAWRHSGERKVDLSDDGVANPEIHNRIRSGVGFRLRKGAIRFAAEYMQGEGMIFQGPEKPNMGIGAISAGPLPSTQDLDGKADGYYVDVGFYVPGTKWELDYRYDIYNRSTEHDWISAKFKTNTFGVQYHLNRKTKLTLNYIKREAKALDPIAAAPVPLANMTTNLHDGLDKIGDRVAVQATVVF